MVNDAVGSMRVGGRGAEPWAARRGVEWPDGEGPALTVGQILAWADAHHDAWGQWPIQDSGPVPGAPGESWKAIKLALQQGGRGLPGGMTLAELLAEHRGVPLPLTQSRLNADRVWAWQQEQSAVKGPRLRLPRRGYRPKLTIDNILSWADAHHETTGRWPTVRSGTVRDSPFDENWRAIHSALCKGLRGLSGGSSLARLLAEHRGVRPALCVERILAWADEHHAATGRWPAQTSGNVAGVYRENWGSIADDLREGRRGLPGGTTLARLLATERGVRNVHSISPLSIEQILAWADAHHASTGRWPGLQSGPVEGAPGETWSGINGALYEGWRGLSGGNSLFRLLAEHRGKQVEKRRPELTIGQILSWADAYHAAHGRWPVESSGPLPEVPDESWNGISQALARGGRGLPGGSSLARLLAERRSIRNKKNLPPLTEEQVLAWADAYHAALGHWPTASSGAVPDAPGEEWTNIDQALKKGHRSLSGGSSLAKLLVTHRPDKLRRLNFREIMSWALAHYLEHGHWPDACAGPVKAAPGESWSAINTALRHGRRGLPGGQSLRRLFGRALNPAAQGTRPQLTVEQVLAWADAHRTATGQWPIRSGGPIAGAPGEKWVNVDTALRHGRRGLPPGLSLALLFTLYRSGHELPVPAGTLSE